MFVDGNEVIAFDYLNAAGIPDSLGQAWPASKAAAYPAYPDVLSPSRVRGPTIGGAADGALLRADGTPAYCQITSMHYAPPADEEVVREVRAWLNVGSTTHAFMECHATTTFENAVNGRFLTNAGLVDDGATPTPITNRQPDSAFSQYDGTFTPVGGSVDSMGLAVGSTFYASDVTLINLSTAPPASRIVWMTGNLDGNAGHQYTMQLPISSRPSTNGVRLFLDSLFESLCATTAGQPTVTFTKTAPAIVPGPNVTYTLSYANTGPGVADGAVITDPIPAGTTFVSATGGGTFAAGLVTWNLGNLASGASGSVTLVVATSADGSYTNQGRLTYKSSLTPKRLVSNTTVTVSGVSAASSNLSVLVSDAPDPVALAPPSSTRST